MTNDDEVARGHKAPVGKCAYCDHQRQLKAEFHPSHRASQRCQSGGRNHCTCDTCF